MKVTIQVPVWNGHDGREQVGVNEASVQGDGQLEVTIGYTDKFGNKPFPETYVMSNEKARNYHLRARMGHIPPLYMIPIKDFEIL